MITHSCGAKWTSAGACHCAGCHTTFSSISAFEKHRRNLVCLTPAKAGLVLRAKPKGDPLWGLPGTWAPKHTQGAVV